MKLKIVHQNQERRKEDDHCMKQEALEMEDAQIRASPEDDSTKELLEPSPVDPLLVSVSDLCLECVNLMVSTQLMPDLCFLFLGQEEEKAQGADDR